MNARRVAAAFLVALLCSGLFTWMLSKRLAKPAAAVRPAPVRQIVVAAKDFQAGEALDATRLETVSWPATRALPGAFDEAKDVAGRVLLYPLSSGEPVLAHDLAAPGAGMGLMASIPDGMRAISVRADEAADVSGFVMPGSSVDVLVTYPTGAGPGFASSTVLEDVRVLAVGQETKPDPQAKPIPTGTVTLLVTPQETVDLTRASSLGKIALVLRNGADPARPAAVSQGEFPSAPSFGSARRRLVAAVTPPASTATPKPAASFTVETIAGGKKTIQTFEGDGQ